MTDSAKLDGWLAEVAEAIGTDVALKLARECGGTEVYLSPRPRAGSPVVKAVGFATAQRMGEIFGHGRQLVPLGPFNTLKRRRELIARARDEGASVPQAARQAGAHMRTVYRIDKKRKGDKDDPQGSLL